MSLLARVSRPAPWLTLAFAIGFVAYTSAQVFQDASFRASPPVAAKTARVIPPPRLPVPAEFIGWQLFGSAPPNDTQAASAPETALNLTLRGILHDLNSGAARAIISGAGPRERVVAAGTALEGGIQLEQILPDKVLLRRAGRLETLSLNRRKSGMESAEAMPVLDGSITPGQSEPRYMPGAPPVLPAPAPTVSTPATPPNPPHTDGERASAALLQERRAALQQQVQAGRGSGHAANPGEIPREEAKP